jgi:hypothetical protein
MKLLKKSMLFLGILFVSINIFGVEALIQKALPAAIVQIIAKFAPPARIKQLIQQNKETILALPDDGQVHLLETSPKIYVKSSQFDRILNAYRMQNFFTQHGITTITVPKKYVSKVGFKFMVFVEAADVEEVKSINLQEMKDLISFIEGTGYCDLHKGNLKRDTKTGKLIIVDTETRSFCKVRFKCFDIFKIYFESVLTPEALKQLKDHCKKYYQKCLCEDTQYDGGIDFSVVKDYITHEARLLYY